MLDFKIHKLTYDITAEKTHLFNWLHNHTTQALGTESRYGNNLQRKNVL